MTDQEIERIKEALGKDFKVTAGYNCAVVEIIDIWKGVEFSECVTEYFSAYHLGKIYPFNKMENGFLITKFDEYGSTTNGLSPEHFKPATEAQYVEQLKVKAKELYGEIKEGDRFDRRELGYGTQSIGVENEINIRYDREGDSLSFNGWVLYEKGKWAKKVEEPIEVEPYKFNRLSLPPYSEEKYSYVFIVKGNVKKDLSGVSDYLAKCLQEYLSK